MTHQQEENEKKNKRKGLWYAWFFGGMVLGMAMLPFMRSDPPDPPPPVIEIQFADFQPREEAGASQSRRAESQNVSEEPKPPKVKPMEELSPPPEPDPIPVPERPQPKPPVLTSPEPNPPVVVPPDPVEVPKPEPKPVEKPRPKPPVTKPTPKPSPRPTPPAPRPDPSPVVVESGEPSDRNEEGSASQASDKEQSGTLDGNSDSGTGGTSVTEGSGDGGDSGDGVLKRKPVYRVDVKKLGGKNGRITANICIDRAGNVISVEENEEKTTMKDRELVEKAIDILKRYRFERDRSAREKECGTYAFIFSAG
ncbi:MAG: hypothetical protein AB8G22_25285 [Saprospiraceae bacterium]